MSARPKELDPPKERAAPDSAAPKNTNRDFDYTVWLVQNKRDPAPKPQAFSWPELCRLLTTPTISESKDGKGAIFQTLDGNGRNKQNALTAWAVVLDVEPHTDAETGEVHLPPSFADICSKAMFQGWKGVAYTTHSHLVPSELIEGKPYGERYRLVFPLDRSLPLHALEKATHHVAEVLGLTDVLDKASYSAARLLFLPRHRKGYPFAAQVFNGKPLCADMLEALPEIVKQPKQAQQTPVAPFSGVVTTDGSRYALRALQDDCSALAGMIQGERNNKLNCIALRMYRFALGGHLQESEVTQSLEAAALQSGLPLPEVRATLASARSAAQREGPAHPPERSTAGSQVVAFTPEEKAYMDSLRADTSQEKHLVDQWGKCPKPFRGVMERIVSISLRCQPRRQPAMTIAAALAGMSAALHGKYQTQTGLRGNLYIVGLAGSGSGKGSCLDLAKVIAELADAGFASNVASGQGVEDAIAGRDDKRMMLCIDEIAHMIGAVGDSKSSEHTRAAGKLLLELFSASSSSHTTRLLAGGDRPSTLIRHPYLSLFGVTTHAKMRGINATLITDGTLGRCLIVNGLEHAPFTEEMSDGGLWRTLNSEIGSLAKAIGQYGDPLGNGPEYYDRLTTVRMDEGASALRREIIRINNVREQAADEITRTLISRSLEQASRIALVLAIWDAGVAKNAVIRRDHLQWGIDFVRYSQECLLSFVENMTDSPVVADAEKLLAFMREAVAGKQMGTKFSVAAVKMAKEIGLVQHSALMKKAKFSAERMAKAIAYLEGTGEIITKSDGSKSGKAYQFAA